MNHSYYFLQSPLSLNDLFLFHRNLEVIYVISFCSWIHFINHIISFLVSFSFCVLAFQLQHFVGTSLSTTSTPNSVLQGALGRLGKEIWLSGPVLVIQIKEWAVVSACCPSSQSISLYNYTDKKKLYWPIDPLGKYSVCQITSPV